MASSTTTATEELEGLRAAVHEAQRRVTEAEAAALQGRRRLERARGPLLAYFEQLGAGEIEADPEEERGLRAAVTEAQSHVSTRPVLVDGATVDFTPVDDEAEARLEGARRALEDRQNELYAYAGENVGALLDARVPNSLAVAARLREALEALVAVDGEWSREIGAYRGLLALRSSPRRFLDARTLSGRRSGSGTMRCATTRARSCRCRARSCPDLTTRRERGFDGAGAGVES